MKKICLSIPLAVLLGLHPLWATTITGSSQESRSGQWLVGAGFNLTAQSNPPFSHTFTFTNAVLTKKVQISYRCLNCGVVLFLCDSLAKATAN